MSCYVAILLGYYYECHGIPTGFYRGALWVSASLTVMYIICSLYNLIWLLNPFCGLSSRLMRSYIAAKTEKGGGEGIISIYHGNRDLRLLLGLLANRSGVSTVISVLAILDKVSEDERRCIILSCPGVSSRLGGLADCIRRPV